MINNLTTMYFEIQCGLKQENIISPTIFPLYMNDLVDELNSLITKTRLFKYIENFTSKN